MNCWKTINITRQYGTQRIVTLSFITMILAFILLYVPVTYFFVPQSFYDNYFLIFLVSLVFMYPVHKFLHYLPLFYLRSKVTMSLVLKYGFYPIVNVTVKEPISKKAFLLSVFTPMFAISALLIFSAYFLPNYIHYFTMLAAFNIGLSVPDFIRGFKVISAPKCAFIEENDEGFQILIVNSEK